MAPVVARGPALPGVCMRHADSPSRALRTSRFVLAASCLGLLAAAAHQLRATHAQLRAVEKELAWTQARLSERREVARRQRGEIAQLAAGIDRAARVTAGAGGRAPALPP